MALTTLPQVPDETGKTVAAQPVILVDIAGAYVAAGGGGGGGGGDASDENQATQIVAEQAIQVAAENTAARIGNTSDAAATVGSTGTVSGKLRLMTSQLAALIAQIPATLGIKTAANSLSVAPASDAVFFTSISGPTQASFGIVAKATPFGELTVTAPVVPLLVDNFDAALNTTDLWTASGTQVPVNTSGAVVLSLPATNSVSSVLVSQTLFSPSLQAYVLALQMEIGAAQTNPNAHRFFGVGLVTAYATATPLTNGFGFEIDLTGALNLVVYKAGTRYVVNSTNPSLITASGSWDENMTMGTYGQTLTWPSTGNLTVVMRYVNGTTFFYTNAGSGVTFDVPVGVASWVPAAVVLPIRMASITTAAVSTVLATTFTGSGLVLGGPLGNVITDQTYPFRGVTIKKASTAVAATDLPMAVGLHPTSPLPAGTNAIGSLTGVVAGVAATSLGKAEDAVAASGDTGVATWGVRRDTLVSSASASGDYSEKAVGPYGEQLVRQYEKHARTYSCAVNVAAAAAATDIATITGSATTTVYVTKIIISGIQTTAGLNDVLLVKRSTANTGGTSSGGVEIPHDSADAAATATVLAYTANPTLGTPVGEIRRNYLPIAGVTSVVNPVVTYDFGERGRPIILRGIAQVLAVNLNGATITGGTFDVNFEWFEI